MTRLTILVFFFIFWTGEQIGDFKLLTDCKAGNRYKLSTGEEIVTDCELSNGLSWIVGWNPENFIGLRDSEGILAMINYKNKGEDGYIINTKVYSDQASNEYIMVCVFGEEDGDWGFQFFRVKNNIVKPIGNISLTEYSIDQGDYSQAPEDKLTLKRGPTGLEIDFQKNKYQIWDKAEKKWIVIESALHYRETNGAIVQLD